MPAASCTVATQATACNDGNPCTTDTCSGGTCSNTAVTDLTTCASGYCCDGECDTTIGHGSYHADCRGAVTCIGDNAAYSSDNDGEACGGFKCRTCIRGECAIDNDALCGSSENCVGGTCMAVSTAACSSGAGCNDNNPCTADTCTGGTCSNVKLDSGVCSSCTGDQCACRSGACLCLPDCQSDPCAGDGCGGTCSECQQGSGQGSGEQLAGSGNETGSQNPTTIPNDRPGQDGIEGEVAGKKEYVLPLVVLGVVVVGVVMYFILFRKPRQPPVTPQKPQAQQPVSAQQPAYPPRTAYPPQNPYAQAAYLPRQAVQQPTSPPPRPIAQQPVSPPRPATPQPSSPQQAPQSQSRLSIDKEFRESIERLKQQEAAAQKGP